MAEVVSCRLAAWMQSEVILCGMLVTMWQWDRFYPEYFGFILFALFHQQFIIGHT
jgi:hypothetical protein